MLSHPVLLPSPNTKYWLIYFMALLVPCIAHFIWTILYNMWITYHNIFEDHSSCSKYILYWCFSFWLKWSEVAQSCPTLCDPVDCSLPGSSLYGILQARVLEWVAISFSRGSSRPRYLTRVSCIPGRRFNLWATSKVILLCVCVAFP